MCIAKSTMSRVLLKSKAEDNNLHVHRKRIASGVGVGKYWVARLWILIVEGNGTLLTNKLIVFVGCLALWVGMC